MRIKSSNPLTLRTKSLNNFHQAASSSFPRDLLISISLAGSMKRFTMFQPFSPPKDASASLDTPTESGNETGGRDDGSERSLSPTSPSAPSDTGDAGGSSSTGQTGSRTEAVNSTRGVCDARSRVRGHDVGDSDGNGSGGDPHGSSPPGGDPPEGEPPGDDTSAGGPPGCPLRRMFSCPYQTFEKNCECLKRIGGCKTTSRLK